MLGQPVSMLIPRVVGFKLTGAIPTGVTATDVVLTITEMLRQHGVVGKFVEFYGEGVGAVPLANRATIGNMSPEFGSTAAMFPIDDVTVDYLRLTGRSAEQIALVEAYAKEQGLWHDPAREPVFSEYLELDLSHGRPLDRRAEAPAGPHRAHRRQGAVPQGDPRLHRRPGVERRRRGGQGVVPGHRLPRAWSRRRRGRAASCSRPRTAARAVRRSRRRCARRAAASSCSTTAPSPSPRSPAARTRRTPRSCSAPRLLAKNAVEKGLTAKPWVKTSMAPGSQGRHRLLREGRPVALPREARLPPRSATAARRASATRVPCRRDLRRRQRERPRRRRGALGQPQLRGSHQPRREDELPRVAARW